MNINKTIASYLIAFTIALLGSTHKLYTMTETKRTHARAMSIDEEQPATKSQAITQNPGLYAQEGARQTDTMQQIFGLRADVPVKSTQLKELESSGDVENISLQVLISRRQAQQRDQERKVFKRKVFSAYPRGAFSVNTTNKYGDNVFFQSTLIKNMLRDVASHKGHALTFLDIGAGIGFNTELLLNAGVTVVANDLSTTSLAQTKHRLIREKNSFLNQLYLNDGPITSLDFPENSFDGILISHVFHYLPPEVIANLLPKLTRWLKPGGRVYIQAFSIHFFSWYKPTFEENIKKGLAWPGAIENAYESIRKAFEAQNEYSAEAITDITNEFIEGFPNFVHAHDVETLTNAFKKAGFKILVGKLAKFMDTKESDEPEGSEVILIAETTKKD